MVGFPNILLVAVGTRDLSEFQLLRGMDCSGHFSYKANVFISRNIMG